MIEALVDELRRTWADPRETDRDGGPLPYAVRCTFIEPTTWSERDLEDVGFAVPPDLATFWNQTGGATLFEDVTYRQSGVLLFPPPLALTHTLSSDSLLHDRLEPIDLVVGGFLGDQEAVVVDCGVGHTGWGSVTIGLPDYERGVWPIVADSLGEFIERFSRLPCGKYWEQPNRPAAPD